MSDEKLELAPAKPEDRTFIKNIYPFYLHDLSEFTEDIQPGADGTFDVDYVDTYFDEPDHTCLNITLDGRIIGFILLSKFENAKVDYVIQEAFVLRGFRGKGFGKIIFAKLLELYTGKFALYVLDRNEPAKHFWQRSLVHLGLSFEQEEITEDGAEFVRMIFTSPIRH